MSIQVGSSCYATPADAGAAACAAFVPVSQIGPDGTVRTASCAGADPATGALDLLLTTTAPGGPSTTASIAQQLAFPECIEGWKWEAYNSMFFVALAAWATCYGLWKLYRFVFASSGVRE